ncbi:FecCD family ABC transporter permease [Roseovarius sp. D0-M9]|uniref:FecCD family ABC transporter permease n=1 Tax=Roseovarius sp. D0-M9 TaxID=3127117 RepID=UPI00301010A7
MRAAHRSLPLLLGLALLSALAWHLAAGAHSVPLQNVVKALISGAPESYDAVVVTQIRLPRAVGAMLAGASLAAAGALMQGATRNPLADPGLFGLLAGAALAVVLGQGTFGMTSPVAVPILAAAGALAGAVMVWTLTAASNAGGTLTPVLAGAAVTAFLGAVKLLMNLMDERNFDALRIWLSGSLAGLRLPVLMVTAPVAAAGLVAALLIGPRLTALGMGDETAKSLGFNLRRLRAATLVAVVVLTACAVALAGPLGFVGLTVPHVARLIAGVDYGRIVPLSMMLGAICLLAMDTAARVAVAPAEMSVGILTALIGAPVFVLLVRSRL